jgi:hypothetical protein
MGSLISYTVLYCCGVMDGFFGDGVEREFFAPYHSLDFSLNFLQGNFCKKFPTRNFLQGILYKEFPTRNFLQGIFYKEFPTRNFLQITPSPLITSN